MITYWLVHWLKYTLLTCVQYMLLTCLEGVSLLKYSRVCYTFYCTRCFWSFGNVTICQESWWILKIKTIWKQSTVGILNCILFAVQKCPTWSRDIASYSSSSSTCLVSKCQVWGPTWRSWFLKWPQWTKSWLLLLSLRSESIITCYCCSPRTVPALQSRKICKNYLQKLSCRLISLSATSKISNLMSKNRR